MNRQLKKLACGSVNENGSVTIFADDGDEIAKVNCHMGFGLDALKIAELLASAPRLKAQVVELEEALDKLTHQIASKFCVCGFVGRMDCGQMENNSWSMVCTECWRRWALNIPEPTAEDMAKIEKVFEKGNERQLKEKIDILEAENRRLIELFKKRKAENEHEWNAVLSDGENADYDKTLDTIEKTDMSTGTLDFDHGVRFNK